MKSLLVLFFGILAFADYPFGESYADYTTDFDSSLSQSQPKDPPNYFSDLHHEADQAAKAADYNYDPYDFQAPTADPNLAGGTTEPSADPNAVKPAPSDATAAKPESEMTEEEKDKDFYDKCTAKGFAPSQCCRTCVENYLSSWAANACEDAEDCKQQEMQKAEDAARSPASVESSTGGVGVGQ
jgi:hypothetical protein